MNRVMVATVLLGIGLGFAVLPAPAVASSEGGCSNYSTKLLGVQAGTRVCAFSITPAPGVGEFVHFIPVLYPYLSTGWLIDAETNFATQPDPPLRWPANQCQGLNCIAAADIKHRSIPLTAADYGANRAVTAAYSPSGYPADAALWGLVACQGPAPPSAEEQPSCLGDLLTGLCLEAKNLRPEVNCSDF